MGKIEEQEKIFEIIKKEYMNNNIKDDNDIRNIIINYGFTDEEKQVRVKKSLFDFKGQVKTKGLIINDEHINFIPISSIEPSKEELETALKIYISLDSNYLTKGYNEISSFLKNNSIKANSKARNNVANDDITIRVPNFMDAYKIKNYIKDNMNLNKHIKHTNPFLAQDEVGMAYSMDGVNTSVNKELSIAMLEFLNMNSNNLNNFNRNSFKKYLHDSKTKFYLAYQHAGLLYPESMRIRALLEMSMEESFGFKEMITYTSYVQLAKDQLSRFNINELLKMIFESFCDEYSLEDSVNMLLHIEKLDEKYFTFSDGKILSDIYLTNELAFNYLNTNGLINNNQNYHM